MPGGIASFRKALAIPEVNILRHVAGDDIVVTHQTFHATHTAPVMGIPVRPAHRHHSIDTGSFLRQNIFLKTKK
jgi:hypothetical protein